jgi:DNA-binding CsgD family transcriptional regulator
VERLTSREGEVPVLLTHGSSNAEIAERLFLSEATVKTHVGRVLPKLGLRDRAQAVGYAYESGPPRPSPRPRIDLEHEIRIFSLFSCSPNRMHPCSSSSLRRVK